VALAAAAGCGSSTEPLQPPSGLAYASNPADYLAGQAITPNVPSVGGGTPTAWSVAPTLPAGLALDAATGTLTGTPTALSGPAEYLVTAGNAAGSATAALTIAVRGLRIQEPCAPPDPDPVTFACTYPARCAAPFDGAPQVDVRVAQVDLRIPFQVDSTLAGGAASGPASGDARLELLEVSYPGASLFSWTASLAATVPAGGSTTVLLPLVRPQDFDRLVPAGASTGSVMVRVRVRGTTGAGAPFATDTFSLPVAACAGCLADPPCPAGQRFVSCPWSDPEGASPGQSAAVLCVP
jgi:hypothetical protein